MAAQALEQPPFTSRVVKAMRSLYPEELADRSWDNVGLLLDNIKPSTGDVKTVVLVTNDLTIRVAEEAIRKKASVIVSYHPFLFRPLKSVSLKDPHQRILLQLAQHNIAVYSPHTAVDAAPGGMNDWLADLIARDQNASSARTVVQPIEPSSLPAGLSVEGDAGYGRLVTLAEPVSLEQLVQTYAAGLGGLRYLSVARPRGRASAGGHVVRTVAVCAGSGYDVLRNCDADVLVTGEVSHHSALKAVIEGRCVVTAFHSNSERRYLHDVLAPRLKALLREHIPAAEVLVSEEDEDPFEVWDVGNGAGSAV
ncbi:hypothetical protein VTK73DRAFT_4765 [Phialemonium thermophilum]|uniref:Uncharacterized protein n=1 Tax=Phialemonium thermophilum TaxID=223376 RepID=A0ABR3WS62_9PEZI